MVVIAGVKSTEVHTSVISLLNVSFISQKSKQILFSLFRKYLSTLAQPHNLVRTTSASDYMTHIYREPASLLEYKNTQPAKHASKLAYTQIIR